MFKFYSASGAGMLASRPLDAWAQNIFANSGNWPNEPAVWFAGALMIAFLWARVLMIQYRYLRSRLDDSRESVGRNDEYREMLNVSPDGVMISVNDRLLYANPAALKLCGAATFGLLADKRPITLVDSGFLRITEAMRRESLKTRRGTDYSIVRHTWLDGAKIDAEVAWAPVN
jgi:PAS domain-containing protein